MNSPEHMMLKFHLQKQPVNDGGVGKASYNCNLRIKLCPKNPDFRDQSKEDKIADKSYQRSLITCRHITSPRSVGIKYCIENSSTSRSCQNCIPQSKKTASWNLILQKDSTFSTSEQMKFSFILVSFTGNK